MFIIFLFWLHFVGGKLNDFLRSEKWEKSIIVENYESWKDNGNGICVCDSKYHVIPDPNQPYECICDSSKHFVQNTSEPSISCICDEENDYYSVLGLCIIDCTKKRNNEVSWHTIY